jgi:hypothetical protein
MPCAPVAYQRGERVLFDAVPPSPVRNVAADHRKSATGSSGTPPDRARSREVLRGIGAPSAEARGHPRPDRHPEQVFAEYMAHPTAAAARRRERRGPSIGAEWTGRSSAARDHRVHLWTPFGIKSAAISSPVPRIEAAINDGLSAITMCLKNRFQCVTLLTLLDCLLMSLFPRGHRPISGGAFSSRGGGHVGNRSTR